MSRYAANTSVSVAKSKGEIEDLLQRYGASQFVSGWDGDTAVVGFVFNGRHIRFDIALPSRTDKEFTRTETGRTRSTNQAHAAWEQANRARWRALLLVIKAKLEAVECGISTIELEFMAWTVVPGTNRTIAEFIEPQMAKAIETGRPPQLLLGPGNE